MAGRALEGLLSGFCDCDIRPGLRETVIENVRLKPSAVLPPSSPLYLRTGCVRKATLSLALRGADKLRVDDVLLVFGLRDSGSDSNITRNSGPRPSAVQLQRERQERRDSWAKLLKEGVGGLPTAAAPESQSQSQSQPGGGEGKVDGDSATTAGNATGGVAAGGAGAGASAGAGNANAGADTGPLSSLPSFASPTSTSKVVQTRGNRDPRNHDQGNAVSVIQGNQH